MDELKMPLLYFRAPSRFELFCASFVYSVGMPIVLCPLNEYSRALEWKAMLKQLTGRSLFRLQSDDTDKLKHIKAKVPPSDLRSIKIEAYPQMQTAIQVSDKHCESKVKRKINSKIFMGGNSKLSMSTSPTILSTVGQFGRRRTI
uniref:AMP-binding domain-containing protein n=1 Tax=Heterorhabditis bacteriophora TaxID=37862 RepID=A0A1I7W9F8_HETBA